MKLAQYVADFLADHVSPVVFGVVGGGAMYLNDQIVNHPRIKFVANHHEQASAFAAEAYARVTNRCGVVHVTSGPGVTNVITGLACAWADSLPVMVIAGQVERRTLLRNGQGLRQFGISEVNGSALCRPITKYAETVHDPKTIRFHLEKALFTATIGRKGPVFLEIPLDVQNAEIDPDSLDGFVNYQTPVCRPHIDEVVRRLRGAVQPLIWIGNGVRLAGAEDECNTLLRVGIPVVCSWNGADIVSTDHRSYIGRPGIIGDRAGNYAVQNADLIIAIGTRLSIPQVGHHPELFAKNADLIIIDVDEAELKKWRRADHDDLTICADAKVFLDELVRQRIAPRLSWPEWLSELQAMRRKHPPNTKRLDGGINAYKFLDDLADALPSDAIVVTDVGTSFVCTMQSLRMNGQQRMFHSPGIAPMGYGLPAAIGAALAAPHRQIVCLTGDGGTMFNLQELQTIINYQIPVTIFLYENCGYKTMQVTQDRHFHRESVASPSSRMSWPHFGKLAEAFGFHITEICGHGDMRRLISDALDMGSHTPTFCLLKLSCDNVVAPFVKTKTNENGEFVPSSLEEMWPPVKEINVEAHAV